MHVVFQVLNFIHGNESEKYNLSDDEKLLLINLASHKGQKGIFPSISTIAKERKRNPRAIISTLKRLELKKLIVIDKNLGKSNHYELSIPFSTSVVDDTGVAYSTRVVDDTTPVSSTAHTRVVDDTLYNKYKQQKNNKSFYKDEDQKKSNEKKHEWAAMKNEQANIDENNRNKRAPMPEFVREQVRRLKNLLKN